MKNLGLAFSIMGPQTRLVNGKYQLAFSAYWNCYINFYEKLIILPEGYKVRSVSLYHVVENSGARTAIECVQHHICHLKVTNSLTVCPSLLCIPRCRVFLYDLYLGIIFVSKGFCGLDFRVKALAKQLYRAIYKLFIYKGYG